MLSLIPGGRWAHPPKANSTESGGETNTADQGKTKEVRKGNKRNSDIRKEQNKIASRTYREKRKQKLALLQQLLDEGKPEAEVAGSSSAAASSSQDAQSHAAVTDLATTIMTASSEGAALDPILTSVSQASVPLQLQPQSFDDLLFDDAWPNPSLTQTQEDGLVGGRSFVIRDSTSSLVDNPLNTSSFQSTDYPITIPPVPSQPEGYIAGHYIGMTEAGHSIPPSNSHIAPTIPVEADAVTHSDLYLSSVALSEKGVDRGLLGSIESLPSPILKAVDCFGSLSPREKQRVLSLLTQQANDTEAGDRGHRSRPPSTDSDESTQKLGTLGRLLDRLSGMAIPDVKRNVLHVMQVGFFAAILENALAIGLTQNHELLEEDALSPFGVGAHAHPLVIAQARLKYSNTPKDLQPLDHQILIEHHPYIDVIPFPTFRERALQGLTCDPPLFDEEEMCDDFRRDGMIVWGSQGNGMGMGACTPWDMRSWEPQLWFLKKYWFLVGGWDDELWKAARWWHTMRNEKLNLSQSFTHI